VRFLVWLDLDHHLLVLRPHPQPLADAREQPSGRRLTAGNFLTMLSALVLFNRFFMTLLGYMTEFGITSESTAKWHDSRAAAGRQCWPDGAQDRAALLPSARSCERRCGNTGRA
jgi:hypothetical protein